MSDEHPRRLDVLRLSAEAQCDPRTAERYLSGRTIRGEILRDRIRAAAERLGLVVLREQGEEQPR